MKLAGMHQNGRSEMPISAARKQRSQEAFNEARRDRNIAMVSACIIYFEMPPLCKVMDAFWYTRSIAIYLCQQSNFI